jgi:serine/threonine protein kinase
MHGLEIFDHTTCEELQILGRGGQAIVKQMRHERIGVFACKIWIAEGQDEGSREVGIQLLLQHPNIIRILAFSPPRGPGSPCAYAMEYLRRGGLDSCISVLSIEEKLAVIIIITGAMKFIHDSGFVHADLEPSNVGIDTPFR